MLLTLLTAVSCKESDEDNNEYSNWQAINDNFYRTLTDSVKQAKADGGGDDWVFMRRWSREAGAATLQDTVTAHILKSGSGSGCPLYADSVRIHYRGSLLPTAEHPEGYVFDKSFTGQVFDTATSTPAAFLVSGLVDGMATALQHMHIGDRWLLFIPYNMGYGSTSNGSIPAYSLLKFEVELVAYCHPGGNLGTFN